MKALHPLHVLGLVFLSTPALARPAHTLSGRALPIPAAETAALRTLEDASLGELRAGAVANGVELPAAERATLQRAESANPDLGDLRAGEVELSDRDLTIIAIVVGVLLILILI